MSILSVDNIQPIGSGTSVTVNSAATLVLNNVDSVGVATASNFKTGSSNLHSTGLTVGNNFLHSTGINVGTGATIHVPATNVLTFGTNSAERLRIDSTGRVLIGTTSADSIGSIDQNVVIGSTTNAEEVALTLNVMEGTNNRRVKFFLDDDDGVFGIDSTASTGVAPFVVRMATGEKLRITSDGDLVIGTDTNGGGNRLYVVDSFTDAFVNPSDSILRIENANTSGTTGQASISFTSKTTGSNADSAIVSQAEDASGNARLEFWTDTSNGMTEKMTITSQGYVLKPAHPSFYVRRSIAGDGRSAATPITEWSSTYANGAHNQGSHFNTSTGLFTAPVSGIYHFSACGGYKQASNNFNQKFRLNSTLIAEGTRMINYPDAHSTATISATVYMAAGNTMSLAIETTHHVNTSLNFFSGHLVG